MSLGSSDLDPTAYAAGSVKVSAMVASGEIDVMICDLENAAKYARSETYLPLEDFLSPEEPAGYEERLLSFDLVDDEGNPTGEQTPAYGISMNGSEAFDSLYGDTDYGIFLIGNADPAELSKTVFLDLANSWHSPLRGTASLNRASLKTVRTDLLTSFFQPYSCFFLLKRGCMALRFQHASKWKP